MAILDALKTDETIKEDGDSLGGFTVLESAVYPFVIKLAYVTKSASKAMVITIHFTGENKTQMRQQFWVTSKETKGCKIFYINKKTNEKHYLPGFNQANALCLLTCGKELGTMATDKKVINVYDFNERKEVPTEVDVLSELENKQILAGVLKQTVDNRAKNANTGEYEPTGETRDENDIDKFFRIKDQLTVMEIRAQKTTPDFMEKWVSNWEGKTKDKTSKNTGIAGAPKREVGKQAPTTELFA